MNLQQAQIGIRTGEDWEIRQPDQKVLLTLPRSMNDDQVVKIVEYLQAVEISAFNEGKEIGRGALQALHDQQSAALRDRITSLDAHNAMLAEKLEQLIDGAAQNGND